MSEKPLVHIIGIGPGKAGTTFVYNYFRSHKHVATSKIKETQFFNNSKFRKDYISFFNLNEDIRYTFEVSNQYYMNEIALTNIKGSSCEYLVVFFLRNGFDRLISSYKFELMMGRTKSVQKFITEVNSDLYNNDSLMLNLKRLFQEKLYIIEFENMKKNPEEELGKLNRYLGIPMDETKLNLIKNTSRPPRSARLNRGVNFVANKLRTFGFFGTIQFVKNSQIVRRILFRSEKITITKDEYKYLENFYQLKVINIKNTEAK